MGGLCIHTIATLGPVVVLRSRHRRRIRPRSGRQHANSRTRQWRRISRDRPPCHSLRLCRPVLSPSGIDRMKQSTAQVTVAAQKNRAVNDVGEAEPQFRARAATAWPGFDVAHIDRHRRRQCATMTLGGHVGFDCRSGIVVFLEIASGGVRGGADPAPCRAEERVAFFNCFGCQAGESTEPAGPQVLEPSGDAFRTIAGHPAEASSGDRRSTAPPRSAVRSYHRRGRPRRRLPPGTTCA